MSEANEVSPSDCKERFKPLVSRALCWWFGCEPDHDKTCCAYDEFNTWCHTPCKRCDVLDVDYASLVGDTRHNRMKENLRYWLFRKWWPEKCSDCGHRYKCDDSIDHLPF